MNRTPRPLIRVINPNSTQAITDRMSEALDPYVNRSGMGIDCVTLQHGPPGVASDIDIATVAPLVTKYVSNDQVADAFVIACYSNPGLDEARKLTSKPVIGIGEAAISSALSLGKRFGVISVSDWSVNRHAADMKARGLYERCAGDRPIGFSVMETENPASIDKIVQVGLTLRDEDGADVLITACAGMSRHLPKLQTATGLTIVDPVRAATAIAIGVLTAQAGADRD